MKVLVSGAAGFLGRYVVQRLLERGHRVRAIVRTSTATPLWDGDVELLRADLRVSRDLSEAFDGVEAVIHLAAAVTGNEDVQFASTVVGTERFLEAMARSSTRRFVHVSSIAVYDWSSVHRTMDEEIPLEKNIYEMGPYTISKVWQERLVARAAKENGWDLTIMRPGFIWGPDHGNIAGMGRHFGPVYLTFGLFTLLPLSEVRNCADCLVLAVETPLPGTRIFNVFDSDGVRVLRYVSEYKRRSSQRGMIIPIPYRLGLGIAMLAKQTSRLAFGKKGKLPSLLMPRRYESQFKPIHFSNEKLKRELGWVQRYSFLQSLDFTFSEDAPVLREVLLSKLATTNQCNLGKAGRFQPPCGG
jgi:nucleoside-diphosphate-sugar epimerase